MITAILLSTVLFFSCASSPGYESRVIPADLAGIVHGGSTNTPEEYALLDRMGAVWLPHTFYWDSIEPVQGQWNFLSYDVLVDTARANGKKVMGILAYDAAWIHDDGKTRKYIPPDKIPLFAEYVRQTAAHFRGKIDAWCVWNEPNFIFWKGTPEEYFELARQAAAALREVDADVTLVGGAFNRGIFGLPKKYIRGIFTSGAMEYVDAMAFHPYELNPARTARLFAQFKKSLEQFGYGEKIWVTEVGYPTGGWYPTAVSEKQFPGYVIKTFTLLAISGPQKLFWYQLFDPQERKKSNSEDFFGLVRSGQDYQSKGAEAFRLCAKYLPGTTYIPLREKIPNSVRSFYFEGNGSRVLILWNEGPGALRVRVTMPGSGHARHDPVSGSVVEIQAETIITAAGSMPVFITWRQINSGNPPRISAP